MPNKKYIEEMHVKLTDVLPEAITRAVNSYHKFSSQDIIHDIKNFTAHHAACKAALLHVEYLIKLTQWLVKQDPHKVDINNNLSQLVQQARLKLLHVQKNYEL